VVVHAAPDDRATVDALRRGDESALRALVDGYGPALLRVAMSFVRTRAVAEEVVQETWLALIGSLDRFEGRSSLKTWLFRILVNTAMTHGRKERRSLPFSALAAADPDAPSVDPDRFLPADHDRFPGHWALPPARWTTPEEGLLSGETRGVIVAAIEELPAAQRTVISLRDIEGWLAEEVSEALEISEGNQRVLLHRARAKVRAALERYFAEA
jgi:RNA polymerase sigma-70 factor, ECF subfamily